MAKPTFSGSTSAIYAENGGSFYIRDLIACGFVFVRVQVCD